MSSYNADPENPVLVVVRQKKDVMSWELPLSVQTSKKQLQYYNVTSRTMCHNNMKEINDLNYRSKYYIYYIIYIIIANYS